MSTVLSTFALVRAAEARGVDTNDTLARHGVAREALLDPDGLLPVSVELAIWDELREKTGEPALPLFAPGELPVGTYHVVEYLMGASATVGEAMKRFARFIEIVARQVSVTAHDDGPECRLGATTAGGDAVLPSYVDYTFGGLVGRVRTNFRPALRPARVDLRRAAPLDPSPYVSFFRCEVRFGAAADELCFDRAEWDAPLETHDPSLAHVLESLALVRLQRARHDRRAPPPDVRAAIIAALPDGAPVQRVARDLHMSVRTLQRRLGDAGLTFRDALDTVRSDIARHYLQDPQVAITEVAALLGFADQSSFHRAFERWTGEAPGRWRAKNAAFRVQKTS